MSENGFAKTITVPLIAFLPPFAFISPILGEYQNGGQALRNEGPRTAKGFPVARGIMDRKNVPRLFAGIRTDTLARLSVPRTFLVPVRHT